jgi:ribosomal-protein-alanine N-acetyltransferase
MELKVSGRYNDVTGRAELSVARPDGSVSARGVADAYLRHIADQGLARAYLRGERADVVDLLIVDPRFRLCSYGLDMERPAARFPPLDAETRVATIDDSETIAHVINASYHRSPNSRVPAAWVREDMFEAGWHNVLFPARGDPVAYGCAIADDEAGTVNWVCVAPAAQGRGYGRLVLDVLLHWLGETSVDRFVLGVEEWNSVPVRMYEKSGFIARPKRHAFATFDS